MTASTRNRPTLWGHASLRRRIAISTGMIAVVLVLGFSAVVGSMLTSTIKSAIDADLKATAMMFLERGERPLLPPGGAAPAEAGPGGVVDRAGRPGPISIQVLTSDGDVVRGSIPITEEALEVASGAKVESFETIETGDRYLRVYNANNEDPLRPGSVRVASDMTSTLDGLNQARLFSVGTGLLAGLAATIIALMLGRHLVAPVAVVSDAVANIRAGGSLPDRLEGEGPDELGGLVFSFNEMLDDLRRSREQQRRLVADASHELRTPLTRLRLKIEFIHTEPQLPEVERKRLIEGAVADLSLLGDLVAELLELAAEGTSVEQSQPLQLANVVSTEVDRFRTTSGRMVDLSTTPGLVQTRPRQVTRALTNLLVNADKYSPPESAIAVFQRGCQIEVRDHGPGIPTEERARVFDRFYRGNNQRAIDGSGLGLAIVESVARVNGGTTWIRDPTDGGPGAVVGFSVGPIPSADREPSYRPRAIKRRY